MYIACIMGGGGGGGGKVKDLPDVVTVTNHCDSTIRKLNVQKQMYINRYRICNLLLILNRHR